MPIEKSRNPNIISSNLEFNQYGLLEVSFICKGVLEWPTALNASRTLFSEPTEAFRNGEATTKLLPQYSYLRYNQLEKNFTCTSLLLQDGSPYYPNQDARALTAKDKMQVFAANTDIDQYGLRHVVFEGIGLIDNKPIYPTALASGKSLEEKCVDAFWGGADSIKMPAEFARKDENLGWVWKSESIVKADGSAITSGALIAEFDDFIEYPYPGKVDITSQYGFVLSPGGDIKVKVVRKLYLDKNSVSFSGNPFFIKEYASAGYTVQFEDDDNPTAKIEGCRGYLAGSATAGNTSFLGKDTVGFSSFVSSSVTYAQFLTRFVSGLMLSANSRLAFIDSDSNKWFWREEVFIK